MENFANPREAKEYLIAQLVAEADREGVVLSETERTMLYFSETGWTLPNILQVNDDFEREYDAQAYEVKIVSLAEGYLASIRKKDRAFKSLWNDALRVLRTEDHYLSFLIENPNIHIPRKTPDSFLIDRLKLVGTALLVIIFVMLLAALFNHGN